MNTRLQVERRSQPLADEHALEPQQTSQRRTPRPEGVPVATAPMSTATITLFRVAAVLVAPAVLLAGSLYHPWIGSPGDPGFFARLGAAVTADPTRWAVAHLMIAVGSGLLVLAFLAVRSWLRDAGEEWWSALGLPFIVMGSTLYALLPAMEFTPMATARTGADVAAAQAALIPWFGPILLTAALVFALGVLGFAAGIVRSGILSSGLTWIVAGALVVMAAARFFPVGAAQLYVGPAAAIVALWPLAYAMWRQPRARRATPPGTPPAA